MLLTAKERPTPRISRRWLVAVASLTLGLAVVLSGIGFAQPDDVRPVKRVAPVPVPNPVDNFVPPPFAVPSGPGQSFVVPVIGVAPFHAVPVRHMAVPFVPKWTNSRFPSVMGVGLAWLFLGWIFFPAGC